MTKFIKVLLYFSETFLYQPTTEGFNVMGKYVPVDKAEEGRDIDLRDTLTETQEQLEEGEGIVAIAQRFHGKVALLVDTPNDFITVQSSGCERICAVPRHVVAQAS